MSLVGRACRWRWCHVACATLLLLASRVPIVEAQQPIVDGLNPGAKADADYNSSSTGETHPAVGNLDSDGRAEVVLGFDRFSEGGSFQVLDDAGAGYATLAWLNADWTAFRNAGGATFPAIGRFR